MNSRGGSHKRVNDNVSISRIRYPVWKYFSAMRIRIIALFCCRTLYRVHGSQFDWQHSKLKGVRVAPCIGCMSRSIQTAMWNRLISRLRFPAHESKNYKVHFTGVSFAPLMRRMGQNHKWTLFRVLKYKAGHVQINFCTWPAHFVYPGILPECRFSNDLSIRWYFISSSSEVMPLRAKISYEILSPGNPSTHVSKHRVLTICS